MEEKSEDYLRGYADGVAAERKRCTMIAHEVMHEGDWIAASIQDPNYTPEEEEIEEWRIKYKR